MSNAPARRPPQIKPANMVKAAIKAAKDAGMEVVIGQPQTRSIRTLSAKVRPYAGLDNSKPCKRAGLTHSPTPEPNR